MQDFIHKKKYFINGKFEYGEIVYSVDCNYINKQTLMCDFYKNYCIYSRLNSIINRYCANANDVFTHKDVPQKVFTVPEKDRIVIHTAKASPPPDIKTNPNQTSKGNTCNNTLDTEEYLPLLKRWGFNAINTAGYSTEDLKILIKFAKCLNANSDLKDCKISTFSKEHISVNLKKFRMTKIGTKCFLVFNKNSPIILPLKSFDLLLNHFKSSKHINTKNGPIVIIHKAPEPPQPKKKKSNKILAKPVEKNNSKAVVATIKNKPQPIVPKQQNNSPKKEKPIKNLTLPTKITPNDFVIRCSIFQCIHKGHKLQDIEAVVDVMDIHKNEVNSITIPAGYCPECNRFFIFDSFYNRIKILGIPLCRVIEEKYYRNTTGSLSTLGWDHESIMRQYGYTVSETEGLSSARRQKILAVMIDIGVMTRVEIINRLKFNIRIRENNSRMTLACQKWEDDIEFVSEYNKGHYTKYQVSGVRKDW